VDSRISEMTNPKLRDCDSFQIHMSEQPNRAQVLLGAVASPENRNGRYEECKSYNGHEIF